MPKDLNRLPPWSALIVKARKRAGMTQQALADLMGLTQSNLAKWELGVRKPVPENLMALANVFKGEPESLGLMEHAGIPREFLLGKTGAGMIPTLVAEQAVADAAHRRASDLAAAGVLRRGAGTVRDIPMLRDGYVVGTLRGVAPDAIEAYMSLPADWLPSGGTLYAVKVAGDGIDAMLMNVRIAVVDVDQRDPRGLVNTMVAVRDDGIRVKFLREDQGEYLLVPMNVLQPVRKLRKGIGIVGQVVKLICVPPQPPKQNRRKGD